MLRKVFQYQGILGSFLLPVEQINGSSKVHSALKSWWKKIYFKRSAPQYFTTFTFNFLLIRTILAFCSGKRYENHNYILRETWKQLYSRSLFTYKPVFKKACLYSQILNRNVVFNELI